MKKAVIVYTQFQLQSFLLFALATCASAWLTALKYKFKVSLPQLGTAREQGKVKWFNVSKGFGFITRASGEDIFVHFKSVRSNDGNRRGLREGQDVSFKVVDSEKGLQAEDVEAL